MNLKLNFILVTDPNGTDIATETRNDKINRSTTCILVHYISDYTPSPIDLTREYWYQKLLQQRVAFGCIQGVDFPALHYIFRKLAR